MYFCTCPKPVINTTKYPDPFCELCGDWYDERYRTNISKTYYNDNPKRNDLCPCGSCKKYKKCCGRIKAKEDE